jgi:hypothetical protein
MGTLSPTNIILNNRLILQNIINASLDELEEGSIVSETEDIDDVT